MRAFLLGLFLFSCVSASRVKADVIFLTGNERARVGRIVSQNKQEVRFQVYENGKPSKTSTFQSAKVLEVVQTIHPERLEALSPTNPSGYRNYAEELAAHETDPVASKLAKRLFLIAAYHSDGNLRVSCLSSMLGLAESKAERRSLELLRYLATPGNSNLPFLDLQEPNGTESLSADNSRLLVKLIQDIRRGQSPDAEKTLASEDTENLFRSQNLISKQELVQMTRVNQISKAQLLKLLSVEIQLKTNNAESSKSKTAGGASDDWGELAFEKSDAVFRLPNLKSVTEFDPTLSVFRDGQWALPREK
jgi:hypothetical protein